MSQADRRRTSPLPLGRRCSSRPPSRLRCFHHTEKNVFQPTGGEDLPTTSVPSGPTSVENGAVSPILAQPTQTHISNLRCAGTHPLQVLSETQCPGVACSPLSPPPVAAWARVPPLGAGAPHQWEGAQNGKQSLAGDSAKSHSQQRPRAEVTLVQIRSGGATRKEATRKRWKTQAQAALLFLTRSSRRPNNGVDCAHSTGGTQRECSLISAG